MIPYWKLKLGTFAAIMLLTVLWAKLNVPFWIIFYLCAAVGIGIGMIHTMYPQTKHKKSAYDHIPTDTAEESLHRAYLSSLSGPEFEDEVLGLFQNRGYDANKTTYGTPGIDIRGAMVDKETGEILESVVIQCKRFTDRVNADKIREFAWHLAQEPPGTKGYFATSSAFSMPAIHEAGKHGILLIDGDTLKKYTN